MKVESKVQVTELQKAMLIKIATCEFNGVDGIADELDQPFQSTTLANMIIESCQDKGVFTSMLNADLVFHNSDEADSTVGFTQKGFEIFKNIW